MAQTKKELAVEIFKANPDQDNKTFVAALVKMGMTTFGARTYAYNIRKGFADGEPAPKDPKAPKAEKPAKTPKIPNVARGMSHLTKKKDAANIVVEVETPELAGAKLAHKQSFLSFVPWNDLSAECKAEFLAQVPPVDTGVTTEVEATEAPPAEVATEVAPEVEEKVEETVGDEAEGLASIG